MIFDIPDLTAESALKLNDSLHALAPFDKMTLDFSNMTNFDPFAMLLAGSVIRSYRMEYPDVPFCLHGHENKSYAGVMGFFKYISPNINFGKMPGESLGSSNYIPITPIHVDKLYQTEIEKPNQMLVIGELIEKEASRLSQIVDRGENNELHYLLTFLIREIIRNTSEHAKCSTVWICGQFWPSFQIAEIALLDQGIGIYNSITKNSFYKKYVIDDKTALEWAVKAGISESFSPLLKQKNNDEWANSGFGLYMVSNICKMLEGCFNLVSGKNFIKINKEETFIGETQFNGTAIRIRISTQGINDAQSIISQVSKQGIEEAKNLKHAFRMPSRPSKELMI